MTIFLIGTRASGKTTVGRMLAERLGCAFVDLDAVLLDELGGTIENFVQQNGWPAFRERESACLQGVCRKNIGDMVLATGGGVPLAEMNRKLMRARGHVVWLNTPAADVLERLLANPLQGQRPSLTGQPVAEEALVVAREREPVYRSCCHTEVNGGLAPEEVCDLVLETVRKERE